MAYSAAAILTLASQCAPTVAPETVLAIVQTESSREPFALNINGGRQPARQRNAADAAATAQRYVSAGYSVDLGLGQINSRNMRWLGLTWDTVFEPCTNLAALGRVTVHRRRWLGTDAFTPAVVFEAQMLVPPPIGKRPWLLIRHPDFTLTFKEEGLNFQTSGAFGDGLKTLDAWANLVRALSYLASGTARLAIDWGTKGRSSLTLPVDQPIDGPYLDQLPAITKLLDGWQRLLELAGLKSAEPFAFDAIWDANAAAMAVDILLSPASIAFFEFDSLDGAVEGELVEAIYFNSCSFADTSISYCVQVTLKAEDESGGRYRSVKYKPLDVRPAVSDLEEYGMEQAHNSGLSVVIHPENVTMVDTNDWQSGIAAVEVMEPKWLEAAPDRA